MIFGQGSWVVLTPHWVCRCATLVAALSIVQTEFGAVYWRAEQRITAYRNTEAGWWYPAAFVFMAMDDSSSDSQGC